MEFPTKRIFRIFFVFGKYQNLCRPALGVQFFSRHSVIITRVYDVFEQIRNKDAEHEDEIMQIKQKVGQDQRFILLPCLTINLFCLLLVIFTYPER